ncbi:MAG: response regulator transcription factor [Propionibacteriales bacterium]|nr:response regulator transcription factor [Propionibacteriales bacterium]
MTTTLEPDETRLAAPRVLIVDDTEDARSLLRIRLANHGSYCVVGEAVDGLDAIRQARLLQPELVILDMAMPRMDGLEALPLIRSAAPAARVIVLTVLQPGTLEEMALAAGADCYVVKGGTLKQFIGVIDAVLGAA